MEKAILRTLIYADIFDYPLKAWEIHKWLIGKRASLRQVEKGLRSKRLESRIKNKAGFYFLNNRSSLVKKRLEREKISNQYFKKAKIISYLLKIIPWIKLVGISGGVAMKNASKNDDIDLFIVTEKNRIFISRLLILGILEVFSLRRKREENSFKSAGKICINILLDTDSLAQSKKDIYLAHEVLQMIPLLQRDATYQKFLEDNDWVHKLLPNWSTTQVGISNTTNFKFPIAQARASLISNKKDKKSKKSFPTNFANLLEKISRFYQLKYMGKIKGKERISNSALFFHPNDYHDKIIDTYNIKLRKILN